MNETYYFEGVFKYTVIDDKDVEKQKTGRLIIKEQTVETAMKKLKDYLNSSPDFDKGFDIIGVKKTKIFDSI
jgi:hypothetical protein